MPSGDAIAQIVIGRTGEVPATVGTSFEGCSFLMTPSRLFTIGHSTRSLEEFADLLATSEVTLLADIRRYPGSRRYPHFSREALAVSLPQQSIGYLHMAELGGRRRPAPDSPNGGWRNDQFRAYADYMATDDFRLAVDRLLALREPAVGESNVAVMCAEAVPWRCHRNLLSDELVRRGVDVVHIIGPGSTSRHVLNPMALVCGDHLEYPPEQSALALLPHPDGGR